MVKIVLRMQWLTSASILFPFIWRGFDIGIRISVCKLKPNSIYVVDISQEIKKKEILNYITGLPCVGNCSSLERSAFVR